MEAWRAGGRAYGLESVASAAEQTHSDARHLHLWADQMHQDKRPYGIWRLFIQSQACIWAVRRAHSPGLCAVTANDKERMRERGRGSERERENVHKRETAREGERV